MANIAFDDSKATHGEAIKKITHAMDTWRAAQAKESRLRDKVTDKSMDGGNFKLFARTEPRAFTRRKAGLDSVTEKEQKYDRRALFTHSYDDTLRIDIHDLHDGNQADIFADSTEETKSAMGRLVDQVILGAVISDVLEGKTATRDATNKDYTADGGVQTKVRHVAYADLALSDASADLGNGFGNKAGYAASKNITAFAPDTLITLTSRLRAKDVEEDVFVTLTPELEEILMKHDDFQNAENIFSVKAGEALSKTFYYRGVNFIKVSNSILPTLSTSNVEVASNKTVVRPLDQLGIATRDTGLDYTGAKQALKTRMNATANTNGAYAAAAKPTKTANPVLAEMATPDKRDCIWFWTKGSIYFASRDELTISSRDTLPTLRLAEQKYDIVNCGALAIDDDYVGMIVLKGTTTATT